MKIEELLKEPNQELALTRAIAAIALMKRALEQYSIEDTYNEASLGSYSAKTNHIAKETLKKLDEL